MKKIILYILILLIISCATSKQSGKELLKNNEEIEIVEVLSIKNNDTLRFNELRLHLSSALYTKKFMYKKFGLWDEVIKINGYENYLIWNKCKLFNEKDEFYNVSASGVERSKNEILIIPPKLGQ